MSGILKWAAGALASVFAAEGSRGVARVLLAAAALLAVAALALAYTPLGGWVAAWIGGGG